MTTEVTSSRRLQRLPHSWDGMLAADGQQQDRQFAREMRSVEIHVVDNSTTIVHGRIHAPLTRVGPHIGRDVVCWDRAGPVYFVIKPPADI